jgi:hypothetical protein
MKHIIYSFLVCFVISSNVVATSIITNPSKPNSDLEIQGKVVSQNCFWNTDKTMIYTSSIVEVANVKSGHVSNNTIEIVTEGGRINDKLVVVSGLPALSLNETGTFHCSAINNFSYRLDKKNKSPENQYKGGPLLSIDTFSPTTITAGTESVLSIQGTGFLSNQGNGKVMFTNSIYGGLIVDVEPLASQYLLWNDTIIQVEVPSYNFGGSGGEAATGFFKVINDTGGVVTTTNSLTVQYSRLNFESGGVAIRPDLVDVNGNGGYNWSLHTSIDTIVDANESFSRALESWRCATDVSWELTSSTTNSAPLNDGLNVVMLDSLPSGVYAVTYSFYTNCSGTWYTEDMDIVFSDTINWNYGSLPPLSNQKDFESLALTMLGFAHKLGNVIENGAAMHYKLSNGVIKRNITTTDSLGGVHTMQQSTATNSCGPTAMTAIGNCFVGLPNDAKPVSIEKPLNGYCSDSLDVEVKYLNLGINPITSLEINWEIDGNLQTPYYWNGNLDHYDTSAAIVLGKHFFSSGTHTVKIWTSIPNSIADDNVENDTLVINSNIIACGTVDARSYGIWPSHTTCFGSYEVKGMIKNNGSDTLVDFYVGCSVNGVVQPEVYYVGSNVPPSDESDTISFGYFNFNVDSIPLEMWVHTPNGVVDQNNQNDTLVIYHTHLGLNGTYTVGGTNPDYIDIQSAVSNLNSRGICGPVVFNIRPGIYPGNLNFNSIENVSATNTVTLQSTTGDSTDVLVTFFTGNNDIPVVNFNNVNHITIKNLTIKATQSSSSYGRAIGFGNQANNILFKGNLIEVISSGVPVIGTNGDNMHHIEFNGNLITGGEKGVWFRGFNVNPNPSHVFFYNNIFTNNASRSIDVGDISYLELIGNQFLHDSVPISPSICVSIENIDSGLVISKNVVHLTNNAGIFVDNCILPSSNAGLIANNIVTSNENLGAGGLRVTNSSYINIIHNSIYHSVLAFFLGNNSDNVNIRNNIFYSRNNVNPAMWISNSTFQSDYNNLRTDGSHLVTYNSSNFPGLSNWITFSGQDSNSLFFNPMFISTNNLHFTNPGLDDMGVYDSLVTDDLENTTRDSVTPDMGVYEESFYALDAAGVIYDGLQFTICNGGYFCRIFNYGVATITTVDVNWSVNGIPQTPFPWIGGLLGGTQSSFFQVGTFPFVDSTLYEIKVWTSNPNGNADLNPANDTSLVDTVFYTLPTITFNLLLDSACNTDIMAIPVGGEPPYTYLWSPFPVTNQTLTYLCPGTYSVIVTDAQGCTATDTITFNSSLSINRNPYSENITVFPNPNTGSFNISLENFNEPIDLFLINSLGKLVASKNIIVTNNDRKNVSFHQIEDGIYYLNIVGSEFTVTKRVIIIRQ